MLISVGSGDIRYDSRNLIANVHYQDIHQNLSLHIRLFHKDKETLLKQVAQKNTHMSRETSLLLPHLLVCWERSE